MDTITHGIVGALIGKAFFAEESPEIRSWLKPPSSSGRVAICAATVGAIFPDIDTLAGPIAHNSLAIMTWHRGITHSVVLLPVWAIGLAVLTRFLAARLRWRAPALGVLFLIYAVGLGSHIFLDVITPFGTMLWSPLRYTRLAWDWLFIVDLSLTSLALAPQLAGWAYERAKEARNRAVALWVLFSAGAFALIPITRALNVPYSPVAALVATALFAVLFLWPLRNPESHVSRGRFCQIGIALVVIYICFAGVMHHLALQRTTSFASRSGIRAEEIAALPLPPWPARWSGMIAAPDKLYRVELNEFGGKPAALQYFLQAPPNQYITAADALRDVQIFNWFARFPLIQYSDSNGQPVVSITSMSFYRGPRQREAPQQQGSGDPGFTNFTYRVVFSPQAQVLSHGWVRPE